MRIQLVDPSAFTPPYDHALAAALARAGADVELVTSRFLYGPVPSADGYAVTEHFYRRSTRRGLGARGRVPVKLAEHVPDMLRYRRLAERVKELTRSDSDIVFVPYDDAYEEGFEDMPRRVPDISKIQAAVGFRPAMSLEGILQSVINYCSGGSEEIKSKRLEVSSS